MATVACIVLLDLPTQSSRTDCSDPEQLKKEHRPQHLARRAHEAQSPPPTARTCPTSPTLHARFHNSRMRHARGDLATFISPSLATNGCIGSPRAREEEEHAAVAAPVVGRRGLCHGRQRGTRASRSRRGGRRRRGAHVSRGGAAGRRAGTAAAAPACRAGWPRRLG